MSRRVWQREPEPRVAVDRILAAAEKVFVERGVSAAGMAEIADAAGCSRGTLYRYFPDRHALHLAYMRRKAHEIRDHLEATVAALEDPAERLTELILGAVRSVRANPATHAWFEPGASATAPRMARSEEIVAILAEGFVPRSAARAIEASDPLRRRFVVRIIVSLLSDPAPSDAEERRLVERFVVPGILQRPVEPARARGRARRRTAPERKRPRPPGRAGRN